MRVSLRVVPGIGESGIEPGKKRSRTGTGRGINRLTDAQCRAFKPDASRQEKRRQWALSARSSRAEASSGSGPTTHRDKPNVYSCGTFPETSIAEARAEREKAGEWLKAGLDPNIEKKAEQDRAALRQGDSFAKLTEDWLAKQSVAWSKGHAAARRLLINRDLLRPLGAVPLADLEASPATALAALQRIEARGAHEVAAKARIVGSMICRYGIVTGRMKHDPFAHLGPRSLARRCSTGRRSRFPNAGAVRGARRGSRRSEHAARALLADS